MASDEQSRDGIPAEVTARYTELMRKHGPGPLPLLEKMEALREEVARLKGQAGAMRGALEANAGCRVKYIDFVGGNTCLEIQAHAKGHPEKYEEPYGSEWRSGQHNCPGCIATAALSSSAGATEHTDADYIIRGLKGPVKP